VQVKRKIINFSNTYVSDYTIQAIKSNLLLLTLWKAIVPYYTMV
jgi:hypothetical protein